MDIHTLHTQAMDLAERAIHDKSRLKRIDIDLLRQALEKESHAALLAISENAPEPTRSILLKSAAHLAIDCREFRTAERLVGQALAGDPPPEIADELRTMFRDLGRHAKTTRTRRPAAPRPTLPALHRRYRTQRIETA